MELLKELIQDITAVEAHDVLNPKVWNGANKLQPKIKRALLRIAEGYTEFLNMPPGFSVMDIIITGSNANYNYTKYSDLDLHIIANISEKESKECNIVDVKEFFRAKKSLWGQQHDIKLHGVPVEVYVQLEDEKLVAAGVYSLMQGKWVHQPEKIETKTFHIDQYAINVKADAIICEIDNIIANNIDEMGVIRKIKDKIKQMRKSGLANGGEYSVENLAFKTLRNKGYLEKLDKYQKQIMDLDLSI